MPSDPDLAKQQATTQHLRVLDPARGILAFYDGRVEDYRFAEGPNWVDDGALSLGIASYALVEGDEALVYDTHISVDHARFIRTALEARGVRRFTVVLSHWHLDHVAGTAAFADCEIIANRRTAAHLERRKAAIEAGTHDGPPAIKPADPADAAVRRADDAGARRPRDPADRGQHPQRRRHRRSGCPRSASCWPATRWRTPSPMSASRRISTGISRTWTGCGRSTRPSSCRTTATPT